MKFKFAVLLLLTAAPVAASQNGYFEAQRLEGARQDKVSKPAPKPADAPKPKK